MFVLRNRFLNTTAWFMSPDDGAGSGDATGDDNNTGAETNQDGTPGEGDQNAGEGGDDGDAGDGGDDGEEDDLADLADLTPEQKAKVKAKMDERIRKETTWRDKQIDRLHAKRRNAEADAEAAARIAQGAKPGEGKSGTTMTPEEIRAAAQQMNAQEKYDAECNATDAAGRDAYGAKWSDAVAKLPKLGGVEVNDMVSILATDNPAVVLYSLANDPELYERVMALPPARRSTEFVKLGMKPLPKKSSKGASKRPSGATPPVTPISGGRETAAKTVDIYNDKVSDEDWYRMRNGTRRKKFSDVA